MPYIVTEQIVAHCKVFHFLFFTFFCIIKGNKSSRGIRVSSYDPDDPTQGGGVQNSTGNSGNGNGGASVGGYVAPKTLGNQRKFMPGNQGSNRVSTISQNYNEKTMLLSSDDEYQ